MEDRKEILIKGIDGIEKQIELLFENHDKSVEKIKSIDNSFKGIYKELYIKTKIESLEVQKRKTLKVFKSQIEFLSKTLKDLVDEEEKVVSNDQET